MDAVIGREKKSIVHVHQIVRAGAVKSATNVPYQHRAGGRAIALPQFAAVLDIIGREKQCSVDIGQIRRRRAVRVPVRLDRVDVCDQHGSLRGTIAFPQLDPVLAVISGKVERSIDFGQARWRGTICRAVRIRNPGIDVLDQDGALRCAIALP